MPRLTLFWQMFLSFASLIVLALGITGGVAGAWVEQHAMRHNDDPVLATQLRTLAWSIAGGTVFIALLLATWLTRRMTQPLQDLASGANKIAAGDFGHKVYLDHKEEFGQLADSFNHMSAQLANQFAQIDEERQKLRAILSGMVEGVIAIDSEQSILFANERAANMLDFSVSTTAGRKLWEIVRQHSVQELVQAAIHSDTDDSRKIEFTAAGGKSLLLHIAPRAGKPARGAVLVFHDTTELRRLERLRQDFVANVSHELKTPLSVIAACAETLLDGGIDDLEHRGRFLERIHEQAQRLHSLILDLLSLARIESGEQLFLLQPVPITDIARECVERHQARARARGQQLTIDTPEPDKTQVLADIEALGGILDNLIDNAVKYTPDNGAIRVRWWTEHDMCNIEIRDTGIGIPDRDLPRIFERFYRVDKARSRELGGTGLGLSIVKHLVQSMQGSIRATSELGKGSTFTICLPKAPPA